GRVAGPARVGGEDAPEAQWVGARVRRRGGARPAAAGSNEERAQRRLEEQVVPLEGEEVLPHGDEGEVERPEEREAIAGCQVEDEAEAQDCARDPRSAQRAVARVEPEEGGGVEETVRRAQEVLCGKQTLAPEEQRRLREEGETGDQ